MGSSNTLTTASLIGAFAVLCTFSTVSSAEVSFDFSGFGTLGYAKSNQSYTYLKHIDEDGTFDKDSILGGQLDIEFSSQLGATIQVQAEADSSDDSGWEGNFAWAFLSYRPTNDWLFRLGKLRVPGYLNSQNRDVGVTYDYARIPVEFDSLSPTYDFTGFSLNKTFLYAGGDLSFDAYYGETDLDWRTYFREDVAGLYTAGSFYHKTHLELLGGAVTYQVTDNIYLAGIHYARNNNIDDNFQWFVEPVYQDLGNGSGYYTYEGAEPIDLFEVILANVGADIRLSYDIRMATEFAVRRVIGDFTNGQNGYTGYISLRKKVGSWTPYIFYSQLKTDSDQLSFYQTLNSTTVPGADTINAYQKVIADFYQGYDQYSVGLGTSYSINPASKIKAEVMLTHVGVTSSLVDAPSGSDISDTDICVFSLSYNFVF